MTTRSLDVKVAEVLGYSLRESTALEGYCTYFVTGPNGEELGTLDYYSTDISAAWNDILTLLPFSIRKQIAVELVSLPNEAPEMICKALIAWKGIENGKH